MKFSGESALRSLCSTREDTLLSIDINSIFFLATSQLVLVGSYRVILVQLQKC